ncbi:MAG: hypothetical protein AAFW98_14110, partial [Pseudomonadota bacterium]
EGFTPSHSAAASHLGTPVSGRKHELIQPLTVHPRIVLGDARRWVKKRPGQSLGGHGGHLPTLLWQAVRGLCLSA